MSNSDKTTHSEPDGLKKQFSEQHLSQLKFQKVLELSNDAILILNEIGEIMDCNNSTLILFEYQNKSDMIGENILHMCDYEDVELFNAKWKEAITKNETVKIENDFLTKEGMVFSAMFTASRIEEHNDFIIANIYHLKQDKEFESNTLAIVDILVKQSIINNELRLAKSNNELKQSLCNQCYFLTNADEVWFLDSTYEDKFEVVLCNQQNPNTVNFSIKNDGKSSVFGFLDIPRDLYIPDEDDIIFFSEFQDRQSIKAQKILGIKLTSGKCYLLGLNYFVDVNSQTNNMDSEFLRIIFSQIFSSFENINTYEQLIENEIRYRSLTENINGVTCIVNSDLILTYVSPSVTSYSYTPEDLIGQSAFLFIHPDDKSLFQGVIDAICKDEGSSKIIPHIKYLLKDGTISNSHVVITNLLHQKGVNGIVLNITDINERIEYENKLRQSEEKFRNIFNSSNDSIFITDLQGNYLEINDVAMQQTGYSKAEFLRMNIKDVFCDIPIENITSFWNAIMEKGSATTENSYFDKEGTEIFFQTTGSIINYQNKSAFLFSAVNITLRKKADRQILDAIIKTEENERSRFARELHDGIGPYLSAIKFFLQTLKREDNIEERDLITQKAMESIDEVIRNVKEISNNISPRILTHFGLVTTIHSFIQKLPNKVAINLINNIDGIRFNSNKEIAIYRICTELINNTLKHAKACKIDIYIQNMGKELVFSYIDDGIGFNYEEKILIGKGSGLSNIINRVNSLNGKYEFHTSKGMGLNFKAIFDIN